MLLLNLYRYPPEAFFTLPSHTGIWLLYIFSEVSKKLFDILELKWHTYFVGCKKYLFGSTRGHKSAS